MAPLKAALLLPIAPRQRRRRRLQSCRRAPPFDASTGRCNDERKIIALGATWETDMLGPARMIRGVVVAAAAIMCAGHASAQSLGSMALPSTFPQFIGYGYGAGHHAPIVRTPGQQPPRMDRRMKAPACYGPLCPEPYAPMGCYGGACYGPTVGMPPCAAAAPRTVPHSAPLSSGFVPKRPLPPPAALQPPQMYGPVPTGPAPTVTYQAVRPVRP
jgi:hypothetical protein